MGEPGRTLVGRDVQALRAAPVVPDERGQQGVRAPGDEGRGGRSGRLASAGKKTIQPVVSAASVGHGGAG